jgi:hypothetical protein
MAQRFRSDKAAGAAAGGVPAGTNRRAQVQISAGMAPVIDFGGGSTHNATAVNQARDPRALRHARPPGCYRATVKASPIKQILATITTDAMGGNS